jgi:putative FmdB family regulatory protein
VNSKSRFTELDTGKMFVVTAKFLAGGCSVPRYEFLCQKCRKPFELNMTISERGRAKVKCPKCKSTKVVPQVGTFMAQTSKKS